MTRRTPNVEILGSDALLINPADAAARHIQDNDSIKVRSRSGETHLKARLSDDVRPGVLFTTFHFPEVAINHITSGILDLDADTPEFKVVAVAIDKVA